MIRFRFGHRWRRERAAAPADAFAFELDGVDLLRGASEERLDEVVPRLLSAVRSLWGGSAALVHVPLPEVNVELVLLRRGTEVRVSVVSLARPAQVLRHGIHVELDELREAALECGHELLKAAREASWARKISTELVKLEGATPHDPRTRGGRASFEARAGDSAAFALRFDDADGLVHHLGKQHEGALGSLLSRGTARLELSGQRVWSADVHPFLFALELSRQAAELQHALDLREPRFLFQPGGVGAEPLRLELSRGQLSTRTASHPVDPAALCRAMFELGHAVWVAVREVDKQQGRNPYLVDLDRRSREGLSHRAAVLEPSESERPARPPRPRAKNEGPPLETRGRLKRLRFEPLWEKHGLGGESTASLTLAPRGPLFRSLEMACAFGADGEVLFRRVATHGVAVERGGICLVADSIRLLCFQDGAASARWFRDHDALTIGPELLRADGLLLCVGDGRAVLASSALTGREVWRLAPPRAQRVHLAVHGHRAIVTTDHSELYGVDLADGSVVFKVTAPLPFTGAVIPWGRRVVGIVGRRDQTGVVAVDSHSGSVAFSCGLEIAKARAHASGARLYVAGERKGRGVLFAFTRTGELEWERTLHLGEGPYGLLPLGRQLVVSGGTGAATLVDSDGQVVWHLGASGEHVTAFEAQKSRGLVVLPGERVRAVEPRGGTVVAELSAGIGLVDLKADAKLNIYTLHEGGTLKAHHVRSHFAVVEGGA